MADIILKPTASRLYAKAKVTTSQNYGPASTALGGLYPLSMSAYQMDEYRMMAGWPVEIPECDVFAETLVSCEGEIIGNRESPRSVVTDAIIRWFADEDTWDTTSLQWFPYQASVSASWESAADYSPTYLPQYEYRVGAERFYQDAINFDSDSREHLWADLNQVIGGSSGYTVVMVANLHSVFGDSERLYNGIWCTGLPTPLADTFDETFPAYMNITLRGETLYLETEQSGLTRGLPIADLLERSQPCYFAFSFGRPYTTLYAGAGPSSLRAANVFAGSQPAPLPGNIVLGRTTGSVLNTADMTVLDLGIYPDQLSISEVRTEVAKLSGIYGGDK